jgi:hypothetical protein
MSREALDTVGTVAELVAEGEHVAPTRSDHVHG